MKYSDDIINLKGIGEKTAKLFYKLGIFTIKDLLFYYPKNYQRFEEPVKIAKAGKVKWLLLNYFSQQILNGKS